MGLRTKMGIGQGLGTNNRIGDRELGTGSGDGDWNWAGMGKDKLGGVGLGTA